MGAGASATTPAEVKTALAACSAEELQAAFAGLPEGARETLRSALAGPSSEAREPPPAKLAEPHHAACQAPKVAWPEGARALLSPDEVAPAAVRVSVSTTPCKEGGVSYWSLGGPAKGRLTVLEGEQEFLSLGPAFTVGLRFRRQASGADGYDSLITGHDSKHWLAVTSPESRLCAVDGKGGAQSVLPQEVPAGVWVVAFLQPRGADRTAVFTEDGAGLFEAGSLDFGLTGSRLSKAGWAPNELHVAELVLWDRCLGWAEMCRVAPRPRPPTPPPPAEEPRRRRFRGRVVDLKGQGLPDVEVSWRKGGGCATDEDGRFDGSLSDAETDVPADGASVGSASSSASTVLSFSCKDFAPMATVALCSAGGPEATLSVAMRPIGASAVVDAALGGSLVDAATGSSLTVAPGGLAYPDGSPVEGPVTVQLSVIDVTDPASLASMPGDFSAVAADGSAVYLQSLGAAWVGATDEQGRELTVREGSGGVTLDLRSKATADPDKLGVDAEMWSFNEASGKWEIEETPLMVDGELAPNSAAASIRRPGSGRRMKPYKMKKKDYKYKESTALVEGCMSPESFRQAVAREGEKSLATNLTKLGYINCDLAYHHPQRAVMLTGRVLTGEGAPVVGVQLWSQGRDYHGRTPDVTGPDGRFGQMIAQFDSELDVEVQVQTPLVDGQALEVFFESQRSKLDFLSGRYDRGPEQDGQPTWERKARTTALTKPPGEKEKRALIAWCQRRRQWEHSCGGEVHCVREDGDEPRPPAGGEWRLSSGAAPPTYQWPVTIKKRLLGPFKTGPPGEFVDLGDLVV